jgi:hypothetical protein
VGGRDDWFGSGLLPIRSLVVTQLTKISSRLQDVFAQLSVTVVE